MPADTSIPGKMRFRFLGDGDCPDWLLAEINVLSRMTSIKMKLLGQLVVKAITNDVEFDADKIKKLTQDAKLDLDDAKAVVAALELLLTSAARYGVNATDLSSELQQLGLPREHSVAIGRLHTDNYPRILSALTSKSLRLSRCSVGVNDDSEDKSFIELSVKLKKLGDNESSTIFVNVPRVEIPVMLEEMRRARAIMEGFCEEKRG